MHNILTSHLFLDNNISDLQHKKEQLLIVLASKKRVPIYGNHRLN